MRRLRRAARAARSVLQGFRRGRIVLLYHRITVGAHDPFRLDVSPSNFAEQLDVLRSRAHVVPVADMADPSRRASLPAAAAAVTFDDGYADNLSVARPILERAAVPATVFAITGEPGRELWWDRLVRLLYDAASLPPELELMIDELHLRYRRGGIRAPRLRRPRGRTGSDEHAAGLLRVLHPLLRDAPPRTRATALATLETWAHADDSSFVHRSMTADELVALSAGGLIDVGAHTVTHPVLARLPDDAQAREVTDSRRWLEEVLGRNVVGFAYPFGEPGDYSAASMRAVRHAGLAYAFTADRGFVSDRTDAYEIPRMWVENWDGEEFARRLDRWLPSR